MKNLKSILDILNFAIGEEQAAVELYTELKSKARSRQMEMVFEEFIEEEKNHKARLTKIKEEKLFTLSDEKIADLKISEYLSKVAPSPDMTYREALVFAMNNEKTAYHLYSNLAAAAPSPELKNIFALLANEELKHKLKFEEEFNNFILAEN